MTQVILEIPKSCPHCGSPKFRKRGFTHDRRQRYHCNNCQKSFPFPQLQLHGNFTHGFKHRDRYRKRLKDVLPFYNCSDLLKGYMHSRINQNVNSIADVPCFLCSDCEKCNPIKCEKMDGWLIKID